MSELNVRGLMKSSVSASLVIALCFYAQLNILRCEMKCIVKGSVTFSDVQGGLGNPVYTEFQWTGLYLINILTQDCNLSCSFLL